VMMEMLFQEMGVLINVKLRMGLMNLGMRSSDLSISSKEFQWIILKFRLVLLKKSFFEQS
jgi:hypothetical protein